MNKDLAQDIQVALAQSNERIQELESQLDIQSDIIKALKSKYDQECYQHNLVRESLGVRDYELEDSNNRVKLLSKENEKIKGFTVGSRYLYKVSKEHPEEYMRHVTSDMIINYT